METELNVFLQQNKKQGCSRAGSNLTGQVGLVPCVLDWWAPNFVRDAGLSRLVFWPPRSFFCKKRHQNTRRTRVTAPAGLEPPKGSAFGLGLGLGSGWSGPTCKLEIDHTRPAKVFVLTNPAHSGSRQVCSGRVRVGRPDP